MKASGGHVLTIFSVAFCAVRGERHRQPQASARPRTAGMRRNVVPARDDGSFAPFMIWPVLVWPARWTSGEEKKSFHQRGEILLAVWNASATLEARDASPDRPRN